MTLILLGFLLLKKKAVFLKISHQEGLWQLFELILHIMLTNCFAIQSCEVTGNKDCSTCRHRLLPCDSQKVEQPAWKVLPCAFVNHRRSKARQKVTAWCLIFQHENSQTEISKTGYANILSFSCSPPG